MKTLLPCPFCGSEPKFGVVPDSDEQNFGGEFIECTNPQCGCSTCLMFPAMEGVKDELRERWNKRTPETSKYTTTVEGLTKACEGFMEQNGAALLGALEMLKAPKPPETSPLTAEE